MGSCIGKERTHSSRKRPSLAPLVIDGGNRVGNSSPAGSSHEDTDGSSSHIPCIPIDTLRSLVAIQIYEDTSPSNCAYCEAPGMDISNMMVCNSEYIPYDMFETLMERGWWRTGNIIFQPQIEKICCPSYAIRMPAQEYQLTKKHRKVLNNWKNFLLHGHPKWDNRHVTTPTADGVIIPGSLKASQTTPTHETSSAPSQATPTQINPTPTQINPTPTHTDKKTKVVRKGEGPDPSKPPCVKAKTRRRQKAQEKCSYNNTPPQHTNSKQTLLELLDEHEQELEHSTPKHKLEIKLIPRNDPEIATSLNEFFSLYNRFQDGVHPSKSKFKTVLDLHWGFVSSPLEPSPQDSRPLGTYHMRYYLDGELIMLSVIDILPRYLVSIYFIYDPHIRFLEPGVYTCLREIALIQKLQASSCPSLVYYNLGYYNDFSPKINYKRQFKPTEILCPITNVYVPLEDTLPLLRQSRFCRFAPEGLPTRPKEEELDIDDVIILDISSMTGPTGHYFKDMPLQIKEPFVPVVQRYMRGTGSDVMKGLLLSLY